MVPFYCIEPGNCKPHLGTFVFSFQTELAIAMVRKYLMEHNFSSLIQSQSCVVFRLPSKGHKILLTRSTYIHLLVYAITTMLLFPRLISLFNILKLINA